MPFLNRIRLPIQLHSAQFPEERDVFRKANGESKTLSVVIRKQYSLETDWMPEHWHQRLKIALAHDTVNMEAERYLGGVTQDGDYQINWQDTPLRYPTAPAETKVQVTPFDATNSNCQTCDDLSQVVTEDDEATALYGEPLEEDADYSVDAAANDSICCYPAVFSITSFNSTYLTSATIDPATGEITIHTGTGLTSANGIVLVTYRATCPNGDYDEADVYGDINGSIEGCLAPTGLNIDPYTTTTATIGWDNMGVGANYYYEVYEGAAPIGTPIFSGTTTALSVDLTGLTPSTQYFVQVRQVCESGDSNFSTNTFNTIAQSETCGSYQITNSNTEDPAFRVIGYINCSGVTSTVFVFNQSSAIVCALENSPGDPVSLTTTDPLITITYLGPC